MLNDNINKKNLEKLISELKSKTGNCPTGDMYVAKLLLDKLETKSQKRSNTNGK